MHGYPVALFFGNDSHDLIVKKYGIRVWNGDKVLGRLTGESQDSFYIDAHPIGGEYDRDKWMSVRIDKADVQQIDYSKGNGWEEVKR